MTQYRLFYFPLRARAEAIRLIFNYKKVPFEDVRIPREEWPSKKSMFPFGQLPVLEEDGKQIAQSGVILRHLARKFDLDGRNECEVVRLDQTLELYREMAEPFWGYFSVAAGFSEGDKEQLRKDKLLPGLERFGPYFERFLKESGSGFYAKNGISYVDFYLADITFTLCYHEKELMESKYPFFVEQMKRVYALPELQHYLSSRPIIGL